MDGDASYGKRVGISFIILAAGLGQRLVPVSGFRSKAMTMLADEPLLARQLSICLRHSPDNIVVAVRAEDTFARDFLRRNKFVENQPSPRMVSVCSTANGLETLARAARWISPLISPDDRIVVLTVDAVFNPDELAGYIRALVLSQADALMGVTDYVDDEKPLYLLCDSRMKVRDFMGTCAGEAHGITDWKKYVSGGIYGLKQRCLDVLEASFEDGETRLRQFQKRLLTAGLNVDAYFFSRIIDLDRPEDMEVARRMVMRESR